MLNLNTKFKKLLIKIDRLLDNNSIVSADDFTIDEQDLLQRLKENEFIEAGFFKDESGKLRGRIFRITAFGKDALDK